MASQLLRRSTAAILVVTGLGGALGVSHAGRLGDELTGTRVVIGESARGAPDPGNAEPLAGFAFGVVGPLEGDHAALERALDELTAPGPIDFVVLLGDVGAAGDETTILRLAATWRAAGVERMAVPGAGDGAQDFEAYVSPRRWWFSRNGCRFLGVSGTNPADDAFVAKGIAAAGDPALVFAFSSAKRAWAPAVPALTFDADSPATDEDDVSVRRVQVLASGGHALVSSSVSRSPTPASLRRDVELGLLYPLVRDGGFTYYALLGACVLMLGLGLRRLLMKPEPSPSRRD